jgi:hypothetical protein
MRYSEMPERQHILTQALDATTLSEIETATRELKQWVAAHPDDLGIVDAFEQLSLMEDIAHEKASDTTHTDAQVIARPEAALR